MNHVKWIESGGGPLVLLHEAEVINWSGIRTSCYDRSATDYARACAVTDELGVIAHASGNALVLGDEPDSTGLIERESTVFIVRWRWAPSEDALLSGLCGQLDSLQFSEAGLFSTIPGKHLLFDSAVAGAELSESSANVPASLIVNLKMQQVQLASAYFTPTRDVCALVHRLVVCDAIA